jgi:ribosomal protein L12E/L44/L45/RPP1/RPP2
MRHQGARPEQDDQADQIKAQIEENLKRVYQSALVEEVPDRFKLLLQQLKDKDAQNTGDAQNAGGQK